MKIEIDLELLEELQLTPNEYVFLHCAHKKINSRFFTKPYSYEDLIEAGWVDDLYNVTDKWLNLFASEYNDLFKELIETYPAIVDSPNKGKRVLHAKDPNALSNMKAKNKYRKITGEKIIEHKRIINLLKVQLSQENLAYFQNLDTWLNNYTWEKYIDINLEEKDNGRITRSL